MTDCKAELDGTVEVTPAFAGASTRNTKPRASSIQTMTDRIGNRSAGFRAQG